MSDSQQIEHRQVLFGLRHPTFAGGHHEQDRVERADSGEHVADQTPMAGNINEGNPASTGEIHPGESQVDGEPSPFLFLEPVGIPSRQSLDESRFAVIDMPGRGYY
jgi:hypothetical protein